MSLFYVHRGGLWHIAEEAKPPAMCGVMPLAPDWKSRMKFRDYDPRLEADERGVCGVCLLDLPEELPR